MGELDVIEQGMDVMVTRLADRELVESTMVVLDENKSEMYITDPQERRELATLFMAKGGTSSTSENVKAVENAIKEVGSPWMLARGVKTVKVAGVGTLTVTNGTNVSISQDTLRKVLLIYLSPDKVADVLEKVVKKTSYVTMQFKAEKGAK